MSRIFSRILACSAICVVIAFSTHIFFEPSLSSLSKEGSDAPEPAVGLKEVAVVPWTSVDKNHAWADDRRLTLASIYDPDTALISQLGKLRALADRSNPYAACVLAWALDLCSKSPQLIPVGEYSNMDLKNLDEETITNIAGSLEFQDGYEKICSGLVTDDLRDMDERLLQSARMGHVRSMTRFANFLPRPGSGLGHSTQDLSIAHSRAAEKMLNAAAEAGDPEAIRGIYNAYSAGYISSEMGDVEVTIDIAKSLAALRATSLDAHPNEKSDLDQGIAGALAQMDRVQRSRFDHYESVYRRAYAKASKDGAGVRGALDDFPEKVCIEGFSASLR